MSKRFKAKLLKTGEVIEVRFNDGWIRWTEPKCWLYRNEFEILEEIPQEPPTESDLTVSLAKLREVLNEELEGAMLNNSLRADNVDNFTDNLINRIKQELK